MCWGTRVYGRVLAEVAAHGWHTVVALMVTLPPARAGHMSLGIEVGMAPCGSLVQTKLAKRVSYEELEVVRDALCSNTSLNCKEFVLTTCLVK